MHVYSIYYGVYLSLLYSYVPVPLLLNSATMRFTETPEGIKSQSV